jgi:hypothetical protein
MLIPLAWQLLLLTSLATTLHIVDAFTVLELETAGFPRRYHTGYGTSTSVKWRPGWSVRARVRVNWVEACSGWDYSARLAQRCRLQKTFLCLRNASADIRLIHPSPEELSVRGKCIDVPMHITGRNITVGWKPSSVDRVYAIYETMDIQLDIPRTGLPENEQMVLSLVVQQHDDSSRMYLIRERMTFRVKTESRLARLSKFERRQAIRFLHPRSSSTIIGLVYQAMVATGIEGEIVAMDDDGAHVVMTLPRPNAATIARRSPSPPNGPPARRIRPADLNDDERQEACAICLNELLSNLDDAQTDNDVLVTACPRTAANGQLSGHYFHQRCVSEWLRQHGTCPNCRQPVSLPN